MKLPIFFTLTAVAATMLSACDDSSTLGNSLISDNTEVVIDSTFTVTGQSLRDDAVLSRTTSQLLGKIDAKEFGSISSDFVTQFMPAVNLDTTGVTINDIDSVKLIMDYTSSSFTGDSLVPMGFKVYPLTRQLESPIYSNFNPKGFYDESNCWTPQTQIYTTNAQHDDSLANVYNRHLSVKLPLEFGKKVFNEYLTNPSTFATPMAFAKFFPGIYVKNTFGSGRITNFTNTYINFYYTRHATYTNKVGETRDTTYHSTSSYLGVTPEIIANNIINMTLSKEIDRRIQEGQTLLVAPTGYNARITLPMKEMVENYRRNGGEMSVINTLTMAIPVVEIPNTYNIAPPANVLLILESEKDKFFANNDINDDKTSFVATYDSTNKQYYFSGLRQYFIELLNKESITDKDVTFVLLPVNLTTESSESNYYYGTSTVYITAIKPYVSNPAMCRLNLDDVKIKFTYSKQFINN